MKNGRTEKDRKRNPLPQPFPRAGKGKSGYNNSMPQGGAPADPRGAPERPSSQPGYIINDVH